MIRHLARVAVKALCKRVGHSPVAIPTGDHAVRVLVCARCGHVEAWRAVQEWEGLEAWA
jgi:hypothetical protein